MESRTGTGGDPVGHTAAVWVGGEAEVGEATSDHRRFRPVLLAGQRQIAETVVEGVDNVGVDARDGQPRRRDGGQCG